MFSLFGQSVFVYVKMRDIRYTHRNENEDFPNECVYQQRQQNGMKIGKWVK